MSAALLPAAAPLPPPHPRPAPLRLGTRGSPLALRQSRLVLAALGEAETHPLTVIGTSGDREQQRRLAELGGKGLFAKEIHEALLDGAIDLAVHSQKDLETELPPGLVIAAHLPREDLRDALVLSQRQMPDDRRGPLSEIPMGARIGTASARRQAILAHLRPDLRFGLLRGNVQSRLARLDSGDFAATILAAAGLKRLGLEHRATRFLEPEEMLPAAGQGIIAITARADDSATRDRLAAIDDPAARLAATAERALLAGLDGSCRTPIGAHARILPDGRLRLTGLLARQDGRFLLRRALEGGAGDAARLGATLAAQLRAESPADILA